MLDGIPRKVASGVKSADFKQISIYYVDTNNSLCARLSVNTFRNPNDIMKTEAKTYCNYVLVKEDVTCVKCSRKHIYIIDIYGILWCFTYDLIFVFNSKNTNYHIKKISIDHAVLNILDIYNNIWYISESRITSNINIIDIIFHYEPGIIQSIPNYWESYIRVRQ